MDTAIDYYAILGVLPSVDHAVLQAVYRVLVKRYHPDANPDHGGDSSAFRAVQEAYDVLGDPEKRLQYDRQRHAQQEQAGRFDQTGEDAGDIDHSSQIVDEDWKTVEEYEPVAASAERSLRRLSPRLALLYRTTMLSERHFNKAEEIAKHLEAEFFKTYFGDDKEIQIFARYLLMLQPKGREAARELNRVIRTIRSPSRPSEVIKRIREKFDLGTRPPAPRKRIPNSPDGWRIVMSAAENQGWYCKNGFFGPKFHLTGTSIVVSPQTPDDAWVKLGLREN